MHLTSCPTSSDLAWGIKMLLHVINVQLSIIRSTLSYSCRKYKHCTISVHMQGGSTPLHLAVQNGHNQVVQTLIRLGADISAVNKVRL